MDETTVTRKKDRANDMKRTEGLRSDNLTSHGRKSAL